MIDEFRKSVNSILYQRVTSPFWGALVASWVIWNWEIFYLTFFVPSDKLSLTKLDYVKEHLLVDTWSIVFGSIITLTIILVVLPFISNGAYWLNLKFNIWKINQKIILENKIPLTVEESVKLRNEILKQDEIFEKINNQKDKKLIELSRQLKELTISVDELERNNASQLIEIEQLETRIKRDAELDDFKQIFKRVSVFEIVGKEKWKLQINDRKVIEFNREDERIRFYLFRIKNYGSEEYVFFLYPYNSSNEEKLEIRLLSIKRTLEIHEFIGTEIRIIKGEDKLILSEMNPIKIYDLL